MKQIVLSVIKFELSTTKLSCQYQSYQQESVDNKVVTCNSSSRVKFDSFPILPVDLPPRDENVACMQCNELHGVSQSMICLSLSVCGIFPTCTGTLAIPTYDSSPVRKTSFQLIELCILTGLRFPECRVLPVSPMNQGPG